MSFSAQYQVALEWSDLRKIVRLAILSFLRSLKQCRMLSAAAYATLCGSYLLGINTISYFYYTIISFDLRIGGFSLIDGTASSPFSSFLVNPAILV